MGSNFYTVNLTKIVLPKDPLLSHLDIELTERCNNACQHCYINLPARDGQAQARELTTEQWQRILREAADLGALSVRFTGGEPLLREDFAELYLYTRRLGLKVILFTNARCITPALADLFARVPPREKIEVTVYGMCPETYDAVACAPGAYQEFRRGVDLLLERQVPFIVKGALLPQNKADREALEAWAATIPWMEGPPGYVMFFTLRGRRDSIARSRRIARLRVPAEEGMKLIARQEADYRKEMQQFCSRFIGPAGDRLFTCGAGKGGSVDAYGFYQPCMLLRDPALCCDLRAGTRGGSALRDALEHFFPRLRDMKATNPAYLERCAKCFLHGLCEQCPAHSWVEHGVLDAPVEFQCEIAHAQARFLGLLSEGEKAWQVTDWPERLRRSST
jgi:MoaA/NifB/PqqE/SkfB family radical SAM enzyme